MFIIISGITFVRLHTGARRKCGQSLFVVALWRDLYNYTNIKEELISIKGPLYWQFELSVCAED